MSRLSKWMFVILYLHTQYLARYLAGYFRIDPRFVWPREVWADVNWELSEWEMTGGGRLTVSRMLNVWLLNVFINTYNTHGGGNYDQEDPGPVQPSHSDSAIIMIVIVCSKVLISPIRSESYQERDNLYSDSPNTLHQNTISSDNFSDWLATTPPPNNEKMQKSDIRQLRQVRDTKLVKNNSDANTNLSRV